MIKGFEDNLYLLIDFSFKGKNYLLLYDKLQDAGFLGKKKENFDLRPFWEKHIKDKKYCLSCEIMLLLMPKITFMANHPPTEIGLSLAEARGIIQSLKQEMGDRLPEIFKI